MFLDPFAITFADPDHSLHERRDITIGSTMKGQVIFVSHCEGRTGSESSAHVALLHASETIMSKKVEADRTTN